MYREPSQSLSPVRALVVDEEPDQVRALILEAADALPGATATNTPESAVVVVAYSGDPGEFLDCGTIVAASPSGDEVLTVPGAQAKATFANTTAYPSGELMRRMRLDARIVYHIIPHPGGGSQIRIASTYLVTKEVAPRSGDGERSPPMRETIAFRLGQRGQFAKETTCQATGQLEQAFLERMSGRRGGVEI